MTFEERNGDKPMAPTETSALPLQEAIQAETTSMLGPDTAVSEKETAADVEITNSVEVDTNIAPALSDQDRAKLVASQKAKRLGKTAEKIRKARTAITTQMLLIADLLESAKDDLKRESQKKVVSSVSRMRGFAHVEAGIPRDEINTYLKLARIKPTERALLAGQGAGFNVLKAIAVDTGLRQDVLDRMQARIRMDAVAVRSVQRQRKLAAETPIARLLRSEPGRNRLTSRPETKAALSALENEAGAFVHKLADLAGAVEISDEEYQARCYALSLTAKQLLNRINLLIDADELPSEWVELYHVNDDAYGVAKGLIALSSIADGEFFIRYCDGYLETDDINVDQRLVGGIADLAGVHPGLTAGEKHPSARRRLPTLSTLPKLAAPPQPLISIELCAGAGGQALGLHSAGFHARAIFEREEDAAATLQANFYHATKRVFTEDITNVDFTLYKGNIDLVAGGVPCQPFSTAGERKGDNDERDLFMRAVEIVDEIQPRAFFFENVQGFGHATNMSYRAELHAAFEAIGYQSRLFPILGSDYGLAQGRPRVAFVGFKDPDAMARFKMPPVFPEWQLTLADAIGDIVSANGWKGYEYWRTIADRLAPTVLGGSRKGDKNSFSCGHRKETWELLGIDSLVLAEEAPGPDDEGLFKLTLAMGARLQGFPDDWDFQGKPKQIKSQIGNAFPPVMAKAVGLAIYAALENVAFDYEQALRLPMTRPVRPVMPTLSQSVLRKDLAAKHFWQQQVMNEHRFFGEVIESLDNQDNVIETIILPSSYKHKDGKMPSNEEEGSNVEEVARILATRSRWS